MSIMHTPNTGRKSWQGQHRTVRGLKKFETVIFPFLSPPLDPLPIPRQTHGTMAHKDLPFLHERAKASLDSLVLEKWDDDEKEFLEDMRQHKEMPKKVFHLYVQQTTGGTVRAVCICFDTHETTTYKSSCSFLLVNPVAVGPHFLLFICQMFLW